MARLAIFLDGDYVEKLARDEFGVWIDYQKLAAEITECVARKTSEPVDLLRALYYNCLPYQSNPPRQGEAERYASRRKFHEALRNLDRFEVREGRLAYRGLDSNGQPIFQQKGIDMLLGLDFALLSAKARITHAAVVTGDSDFIPAFQVAKNEGISVWLFHGPQFSRKDGRSTYAAELRKEADERVQMDADFARKVKRA